MNRFKNGFTLIEMLIAMTLLSVMVVLLFGSLRIAAESWNVGEAKTVAVNKKSVVYQFFKQRLSTIKPLLLQTDASQDNGDQAQQPVFIGMINRLRFVAALPASSARKGLQIFDITAYGGDNIESEARGLSLQVALTPYMASEVIKTEKVELLNHISRLSFAYYGNGDPTNAGDWQDEWLSTDHLPELIKIHIQLDDDSFWPDMVFPVRINAQQQISEPSNGAN
ncbi:prepilin-type N-terminal cleavage/methylation domain-containing protein [Methylomonas paludis]|uniref:Prepilin-type N-terminal cleavage/methylation domain-containing protein n=1 Tax=Methylomonas paludis TaxID=1173101 RepID=A0A975R8F2_9GAMM|nr:prepilin-type N-terminal cleavage/methylation domain-containing protein [Methylomonas paludis]QWF69917.1 prepilin-type N-terminal cleavage/methylation domain-containing protein [Methylomonas paludis]